MNVTARLTLALGLLVCLGCGSEPAAPKRLGKPVKIAKLERMQPAPAFQVTGVAAPYRQAAVSFEVSGRVTRILDVGRSVQVVSRENEDGTWVNVSEVIATMDDTTYRQQRDAASLRLATARAGLKAQQIDVNEVAPAALVRVKAQRDGTLAEVASARAQVDSAKSAKATAESELERSKRLFNEERLSRSQLDQQQNAFDSAKASLTSAEARLRAAQETVAGFEASVTETEASLRLKAENLARGRAEIEELKNALAQAETNLQRCTLRAPFSGRITSVAASAGDFVAAGKPVLTLTLIDPIKVSVTVSADRERTIKSGNHAFVQPRGLQSARAEGGILFGTVFEKGAVADPTTRTFQIDIMVRNARILSGVDVPPETLRIGFRSLLPAVDRNFGEGGPLFVAKDCCVEEDGATVVYRLRGAKFGMPRPADLFDGKLDLDRVVVNKQAGPESFMQILNWSFRAVDSVKDTMPLQLGDLLINFEDLDPKQIVHGVVLDRNEWAIRPGDLVPVSFGEAPAPEGLYVPDDAIRAMNDKRSVFIQDGTKVREVPVTLHESVGRLHRIEGEGIEPGVAVVVRGAHYLSDGNEIVVSEEIDLAGAIRGAQ